MQAINPLSLRSYYIEIYSNDCKVSNATGFGYSDDSDPRANWFVTNWHVVTGRDFNTGNMIGSSPTHIRVYGHSMSGRPGSRNRIIIPGCEPIDIYLHDKETFEPIWKESHEFCDVVCIPLERDFERVTTIQVGDRPPIEHGSSTEEYQGQLLAINQYYKKGHYPTVGANAFVVGFPFADSAKTRPTPIWKAASVASEVRSGWESTETGLKLGVKRHSFYVDTASRPGMSGSPVIEKSEDGYKWIGVYSGRLPKNKITPDEWDGENLRELLQHLYQSSFDAQLGIVWFADIVEEIINSGRTGSPWRHNDED